MHPIITMKLRGCRVLSENGEMCGGKVVGELGLAWQEYENPVRLCRLHYDETTADNQKFEADLLQHVRQYVKPSTQDLEKTVRLIVQSRKSLFLSEPPSETYPIVRGGTQWGLRKSEMTEQEKDALRLTVWALAGFSQQQADQHREELKAARRN